MLNLPRHWRAGTTSETGAFMGGKWSRPLRLIIDHPSPPDDPPLRLLDALTGRSGAQLFSTDVTRAWHVEISPRANINQALTVSFVEPDGGGRDCAVWAPPWRPHAERTVAEYGGDVEETYRALVLAQACTMHDLDGFVTTFPFAERGWDSLATKAQVQDAREAAALLGLYLRAHNDFTVQQEGNHGTFVAPHNFYAGAGVAPLRHYPDWLRLAIGRWRSGSGAAAHDLLRGLELRLGRALRARDYFAVRTRALRPDDSWEEALFFFEAFLLSAAGVARRARALLPRRGRTGRQPRGRRLAQGPVAREENAESKTGARTGDRTRRRPSARDQRRHQPASQLHPRRGTDPAAER